MFDKKPNRCGFGIHEEKQKEILLQMREVVSNMVFINEKGKEVKRTTGNDKTEKDTGKRKRKNKRKRKSGKRKTEQ